MSLPFSSLSFLWPQGYEYIIYFVFLNFRSAELMGAKLPWPLHLPLDRCEWS